MPPPPRPVAASALRVCGRGATGRTPRRSRSPAVSMSYQDGSTKTLRPASSRPLECLREHALRAPVDGLEQRRVRRVHADEVVAAVIRRAEHDVVRRKRAVSDGEEV